MSGSCSRDSINSSADSQQAGRARPAEAAALAGRSPIAAPVAAHPNAPRNFTATFTAILATPLAGFRSLRLPSSLRSLPSLRFGRSRAASEWPGGWQRLASFAGESLRTARAQGPPDTRRAGPLR